MFAPYLLRTKPTLYQVLFYRYLNSKTSGIDMEEVQSWYASDKDRVTGRGHFAIWTFFMGEWFGEMNYFF